MERERGNEDRKEKKSTIEAQPKSPKGTQEELGQRRAHKFPKRPQQKRARERTNGRLRLRPKTRKGERNRQQQKHEGLQSNERPPARAERGLAWERPEERDQGQGIRGRTLKQRKRKRQIPGRKTTRRKRTPHLKEARRPRRTRRKRGQGGRSKRHLVESGTKQPNRNKERQRDAQAQQERNQPRNRGTGRQETMASTPRQRD